MRKNAWMLALGAGIILLAAVALTIGRGWIRGTPEPGDTDLVTGAGPPGAMDENALIAANAERPYRAPPQPPSQPKAAEAAAPVVPPPPAAAPRQAPEPVEEAEEEPEKPVDEVEDDPGK